MNVIKSCAAPTTLITCEALLWVTIIFLSYILELKLQKWSSACWICQGEEVHLSHLILTLHCWSRISHRLVSSRKISWGESLSRWWQQAVARALCRPTNNRATSSNVRKCSLKDNFHHLRPLCARQLGAGEDWRDHQEVARNNQSRIARTLCARRHSSRQGHRQTEGSRDWTR